MASVEPGDFDPHKRASDRELRAFVRANVIKTLLVLVLLFGGLAVIGKLYEAELVGATQAVYEAVGVSGLLGLLFISDAIFSPVPPDVVLVVIANSDLRSSWLWLVPLVGVVSTLAGNVGWWIGWRFASFGWSRGMVGKLRAKHAAQIHRYDRWTVALGATTPLPFSLICITAGALGMRWQRVAPVTLLRIPRFFIFYLVVASASIGAKPDLVPSDAAPHGKVEAPSIDVAPSSNGASL